MLFFTSTVESSQHDIISRFENSNLVIPEYEILHLFRTLCQNSELVPNTETKLQKNGDTTTRNRRRFPHLWSTPLKIFSGAPDRPVVGALPLYQSNRSAPPTGRSKTQAPFGEGRQKLYRESRQPVYHTGKIWEGAQAATGKKERRRRDEEKAKKGGKGRDSHNLLI